MNQEQESIHYAYLFGSDRNCVVFSTDSYWCGGPELEGVDEYRRPSAVYRGILDRVLYDFDRDARVISNWRQVYSWLGRDVPRESAWATFDTAFVEAELQHWFGPEAAVPCRRSTCAIPFVDVSIEEREAKWIDDGMRLVLGEPDESGSALSASARALRQYFSNMVVTKRQVFSR